MKIHLAAVSVLALGLASGCTAEPSDAHSKSISQPTKEPSKESGTPGTTPDATPTAHKVEKELCGARLLSSCIRIQI